MANFCMHCGAPLAPGDKFCPKCGKSTAAPAASPTLGGDEKRVPTPAQSDSTKRVTKRTADEPRSSGTASGSKLALIIAVAAVCVLAIAVIVLTRSLRNYRDNANIREPAAAETVDTASPQLPMAEQPDEIEQGVNKPQDTWQEQFEALIDRVERENPDGNGCEYSLYDIDGDGVPEIFLKLGTCEADYEYRIYAYSGENGLSIPTLLGTMPGFHALVCGYEDEGSFLIEYAHMGYESILLVTLADGGLESEEIYSSEMVDYLELEPLPAFSLGDVSGLDWSGNEPENNKFLIETFEPSHELSDDEYEPLYTHVISAPERKYSLMNEDAWQANTYQGPFVLGDTVYSRGIGLFGNRPSAVHEWVLSVPYGFDGIAFDYGQDALWQCGSFEEYGSSRIEFVAPDGTVLFDSGTFTGDGGSYATPASFSLLGYSEVTLRYTVIIGTEGSMNVVLGNARFVR